MKCSLRLKQFPCMRFQGVKIKATDRVFPFCLRVCRKEAAISLQCYNVQNTDCLRVKHRYVQSMFLIQGERLDLKNISPSNLSVNNKLNKHIIITSYTCTHRNMSKTGVLYIAISTCVCAISHHPAQWA